GIVKDSSLKDVNEELSTYKRMINYRSFEPFKNSEIAPVKIFSKSSYQQENDEISDNIMAFMDASSDEIIIQNPYVVLTEKAKAAIKRASARGVKVIIHTNSPASDNQIMSQAFFLDDDWKQFMKDAPNVRIFVFADKMTLHAKVFVFDRVVSVVGTYNMDYISEQINCENVCVVKSAAFTNECRDRIMEDISISKEYKIGIDKNGKPYEIFGPGNFLKGNKKIIMEYLRKIKVLRPLI
ncbi:MAG TPA: phospholipase D-like domain-containing protein, partial [Candidatus Wallbacteria bacterium]|nr:phospholipase D-like domain-containing protein [Candidatus Wallbacteria bacterium]